MKRKLIAALVVISALSLTACQEDVSEINTLIDETEMNNMDDGNGDGNNGGSSSGTGNGSGGTGGN